MIRDLILAVLLPLVLASVPSSRNSSSSPHPACRESWCGALACLEEESAMVQVKAVAASAYNYSSFHLGDWPQFAPTCARGHTGGFQAPINIAVKGADYNRTPRESWPKFYAENGGCRSAFFLQKPTAWQVDFMMPDVNLECKNLVMEWNGKVYVLLQFHFHTLSEDTVDFQPAPMQMHMVHLAADGSFAVVGVLIKTEGLVKNRFLKGIFETGFGSNQMVTLPTGRRFNPYDGVLAKSGEFWHYKGSFTTPPCTEGVDFFISQTPVVTSASYVKRYGEYLGRTGQGNSYGQNHRPIQPLNGREITTGRFWGTWVKGPVPDSGQLDQKLIKIGVEVP